jgi:hypothetical protein
VVDEADIVADFLEYHLSLGVDRFVATDVGSTDGTLDILARYERAGLLHLTRYDNPSVRAEHRDWLSAMASRARDELGATWCLFCDPDEFWVFPEADARRYLAAAPAPIVVFPRYNLLPVRAVGTGRVADFREFDLVVRSPLQFFYDIPRLKEPDGVESMLRDYAPDILGFVGPKVAARSDVVRAVLPGFHDVVPGEAVARHREQDGYVGHFQARNPAQFRNKARLVADYIAANPPENDRASSRHWVRLAALYRAGRIDEEFARQVLNEAEIAGRLKEGVIERDGRIAARLAMRARANAAAAADG